MFSRTILTDKHTEKIATHQRLVRAARYTLLEHLPDKTKPRIPSSKQINHFEGKNGPDGLAGKHSTRDFPTEMLDPSDKRPHLITHLNYHLKSLRRASRKRDDVRMAFEMAWSQHLIVDGLTPAHHHDYFGQLREFDAREVEEINSILKRIIVPGDGFIDSFRRNWKKIGPKGIGTNHILFEAGIDSLVMPISSRRLAVELDPRDIKRAKQGKYNQLYLESVRKVAKLNMFERYEHSGWTNDLVDDVRNVLIPECVKMIALGWLSAL